MKIYENYNLNERYGKFIDSLDYDERIEYEEFQILENQEDIQRHELNILRFEGDILQMRTDLVKHSLGLKPDTKPDSIEKTIAILEDSICKSHRIINMSEKIIDASEANMRFWKYTEKVNKEEEVDREGLMKLLAEVFK